MSDAPAAAPAKQIGPIADWVNPAEMAIDPYPSYERLLVQSPVAWVPALNRYLVTGYAECHAIECDQETFTADVGGAGATMKRALGGHPMLRKDDPEHAIERASINPTMRPRMIASHWSEVFTRNAAEYLDELADRGPATAELNRDYASPVASQNLIDLLGLPDVSMETMRRWSHSMIAGIGNVHDDAEIWAESERSRKEIDELLVDLLPHLRSSPDESMTSALANSGMPDESVTANVKLTITGGVNEPQHMITSMVWALSAREDLLSRVRADTSLWPAVFDETARWQSPIGMYPRQTTCATVLGGVELPAGASIGVCVAAANRDARHFGGDPSVFDIDRERLPHLAFGSGVHLCAGQRVARASTGQIAVPMLFDRFPSLRVDPERETRWAGWVFRGITDLPVTWSEQEQQA